MFRKFMLVSTVAALIACGPAPQPQNPAAPETPAVATPATPEQSPAPAPVARSEPAPAPRPVEKRRPRPVEPVRQVCYDCGVIASIQEERVKGDATAYGTLGGAAAGGAAGAQFGKKSGKILATIGGAVLGSLAGREVEKQVRATHVYNVTVEMRAGGRRNVTVDELNGLAVGSRVKVVGDTLQYDG